MLTNKALLCQNKEIELKFIVSCALSFMEDMDVSALFEYADSVIESATKAGKTKRLIWSITREKYVCPHPYRELL